MDQEVRPAKEKKDRSREKDKPMVSLGHARWREKTATPWNRLHNLSTVVRLLSCPFGHLYVYCRLEMSLAQAGFM